MTSTMTKAVIHVLWCLFTTHGIPDVVVSDNGPQFTSASFQLFLASQGICQALIAPFHPAGNGQAERAVRSAKEALAQLGPASWQERVSTYLLWQHSTPCPSTNHTPAELLMGRRLRTTLDRLHPSYMPEQPRVRSLLSRTFVEEHLVYTRNYAGEPH